MRAGDLLRQPFAALGRQKLRTALTTTGVIVSAFVLAASLSAGRGVQDTLARESRRLEVARRVDVSANWRPPATGDELRSINIEGEMSEARRDRLREAVAESEIRSRPARRLTITRERLERLAAIPRVSRVEPVVHFGRAFATLGDRAPAAAVGSAGPDDPRRGRVAAGRFIGSPDERGVVIEEWLAYRLGAVDEDQIGGLVGKTLRLEAPPPGPERGLRVFLFGAGGDPGRDAAAAVEKLQARLPLALERFGLEDRELAALRAALEGSPRDGAEPGALSLEFPIMGILRGPTEEEAKAESRARGLLAEVLIPYRTAADEYSRWVGDQDEAGLNSAVLTVDDESRVKEVAKAVEGIGLQAWAAIDFIDQQRLIYLLIFGGMTCVAGAALIVAAIGIANTMVMSVLERTREIGVMKAVGADDRDLVRLFLAEGALIGLVGGLTGLLLAWLASFPADRWIQGMVKRDLNFDLEGRIFVFPAWLAAVVIATPVIVTVLAAVYPALRAARVDPVTALRHE